MISHLVSDKFDQDLYTMFTHSLHAKQEGEGVSFRKTKPIKQLPTQDRTFDSQEDKDAISNRTSTTSKLELGGGFTMRSIKDRLAWEADVLPVWTNSAQLKF